MKVFLTGGSSLLGRTVAEQLAARGDQVTCFQRSPSGTSTTDVLGDVRDAAAVLRAAEGHDAIVHLAALVAPRPTWEEAYQVNVVGTQHVVTAAARCGRLLHVSSPSVAFDGGPAVGAGTEPARYRGRDAYARSKAVAERYVLEHAVVPTVVIRPHLVWGPGDTQLVGRIVDRARQGRLVLPDHGRALVDTTYIDDAAASIVAGLDRTGDSDEAVGAASAADASASAAALLKAHTVLLYAHGLLDAEGAVAAYGAAALALSGRKGGTKRGEGEGGGSKEAAAAAAAAEKAAAAAAAAVDNDDEEGEAPLSPRPEQGEGEPSTSPFSSSQQQPVAPATPGSSPAPASYPLPPSSFPSSNNGGESSSDEAGGTPEEKQQRRQQQQLLLQERKQQQAQERLLESREQQRKQQIYDAAVLHVSSLFFSFDFFRVEVG